MQLNCADLRQLTPEYVQGLSPERKNVLVEQLRQDLIQAQERLNQNPFNSSVPPSRRAPWERGSEESEPNEENGPNEDKAEPTQESDAAEEPEPPQPDDGAKEEVKGKETKRKPGKQPGAKGFGRTQKLAVTSEQIHKPECCKGCGEAFDANAPFQATGGYCAIDLTLPQPGKIGISGSYTKHIFGTIVCTCGFETTTEPKRCAKESGWSVDLGEWRLVGPTLLSFLVFAKLRLHLTIGKTRDFLELWFGIKLSKGCIGTALLEAGRAVSYLESELLAALRASGLVHMDETGWREHKVTRWLWVAVGDQVVYYAVGGRTLEMAQRILKDFSGRLMADGYNAYRSFDNRLRCWAHLERKGKALQESWDKDAATFGDYVVNAFKSMREGVYRMREMEAQERSTEAGICDKTRLNVIMECLRHENADHATTKAFAREVLNDHEVIFHVLQHPELPLTNNAAERALRFFVILRKICYGTKTEEGSRALTLLASVVGTISLRDIDPWGYLAELFACRRSEQPPPPLPQVLSAST